MAEVTKRKLFRVRAVNRVRYRNHTCDFCGRRGTRTVNVVTWDVGLYVPSMPVAVKIAEALTGKHTAGKRQIARFRRAADSVLAHIERVEAEQFPQEYRDLDSFYKGLRSILTYCCDNPDNLVVIEEER